MRKIVFVFWHLLFLHTYLYTYFSFYFSPSQRSDLILLRTN